MRQDVKGYKDDGARLRCWGTDRTLFASLILVNYSYSRILS
jgi:hypothetical protein